MISVLFLEVSRQSYVSFSRCTGCYSRLVLYIVVCKAFYFEGALFFLSAVAFFEEFRSKGSNVV